MYYPNNCDHDLLDELNVAQALGIKKHRAKELL